MRELRSFSASEDMFQQILNQNRIWYWEVDENWKVIHCSEETARQFVGDSYAEFVGSGTIPQAVFMEEERNKARFMMRQLTMGRKQVVEELQMWNNTRGAYGWYRVIATTMEERDGVITRVLCTAQDIEEYHIQQRIYNDEQEFRRRNSATLIASSRVNLTRGVVEEISFNENGTIPDNIATLVSYKERAALVFSKTGLSEEEATLLNPPALLQMYQNGQTVYTTEFLALNLEGTEDYGVQVEVRMRPRPETGDIIGFFYTKNAGRQFVVRSAANALLNFNHDYSGLISGNTWKMYIVTKERPGEESYYSFDYETGLRSFLLSSVAESEREELLEKLCLKTVLKELETKPFYSVEADMDVRGAGVRRKLVTFSYMNRKVPVLSIMRTDIESQVEKEREKEAALTEALNLAEAASAAKNEFLYSVSHSIRTPLNAIVGLSGLMKEETAAGRTENLEEWLEQMGISANHLLNMINSILDISIVRGGDFELKPEPYTEAEFKKLINDNFRLWCEAKGITFNFTINGDRPIVLADRKRKNQMLFNLVSNAVRYTPKGGTVSLTVNIKQEGDRAYFEYELKDTGIGMTPEFMKVMFEPFTQEMSAHGGERGSGLGLAIAKAIIDKMGGTVDVESEPGKGTTVRLHMSYPTTEEQYEYDVLGDVQFTGKKILVVEDHQIGRKIVRKLLENRGAEVVTAADGKEGLEIFTKSSPFEYCAILTDVRMPLMDGYRMTSEIRELNRADSNSVPIIAMTANTYDEDRERAADAGMNAFLPKPVDVREMLKTLNDVLV